MRRDDRARLLRDATGFCFFLVAVATGFLPRGFSADALWGVAAKIAASPSNIAKRRRVVAREFGIGM